MDDPTIKMFCAKATWNKDDEVFMSHGLVKQIYTNCCGNEVKIYQS
jgi:hypothetical protein